MNAPAEHYRMKRAESALIAIVALFASTSALAEGSGTIGIQGKVAQVKDAYAYHHPASYDPAETMMTIVLVDRAIDPKVNEGADRDAAVHAWLDETKAVYWEATLYADGTLWTANTVWPAVYSVFGGSSARHLHVTSSDAKRIEGTFVDPDDEDRENFEPDADLSNIPLIDVKFAVDVK